MNSDRFKYTLTKMSDPGFILQTMHEKVVLDILEAYVCRQCLSDLMIGGDSPSTVLGLINEMLDETLCGLQFMLEVRDE